GKNPQIFPQFRLAFSEPPFSHNINRYYDAYCSSHRLADGNLRHICHSPCYCNTDAGYRGPFRQMVAPFLQAFSHLPDNTERKGIARLSGKSGYYREGYRRDLQELYAVRHL